MAVVVPSVGQRDKAVQILVGTDGVDSTGAPNVAWVASGDKVWMSKSAATGFDRSAERYTDEQWSARVETVWHMPYLSSMDPDLVDVPKLRRLQYGALTHDILRAENLTFEDGRQIRIWTRTRSGV